jgi:predicted  nucleic acid-binding Zn-ribbon protein
MTVDCPGFTASSNPRIHGCQRCGRVRFAHPAASSPKPQSMRDKAYETRALRWITQDPAVRQLVTERLDWGDREYGTQFNDRGDDGLREAADEAIDGIAWLLLHAQNRELSDETRAAVIRACQSFARAYRELAPTRVAA